MLKSQRFLRETRSQIAGVEWWHALASEMEARLDEIPLLELIPENFIPDYGFTIPKRFFNELEKRNIPVMVHSVGLSIASLEPFKTEYFEKIIEVMRALPTTISFSDHLCLTEKNGNEIGQLTTVPYNLETLDCVTRKVEAIQKRIDVPFAIENITHSFVVPGEELSETEFINALLDRTGIELLLDLNNIHTNGVNFGIDPYQWISEIDLDRVDSIHLAGGHYDDDHMLIDGHSARVPTAVWELYEHVLRTANRPITTIVEWTQKTEGLDALLADQLKAQSILDRYENVRPATLQTDQIQGVHR